MIVRDNDTLEALSDFIARSVRTSPVARGLAPVSLFISYPHVCSLPHGSHSAFNHPCVACHMHLATLIFTVLPQEKLKQLLDGNFSVLQKGASTLGRLWAWGQFASNTWGWSVFALEIYKASTNQPAQILAYVLWKAVKSVIVLIL